MRSIPITKCDVMDYVNVQLKPLEGRLRNLEYLSQGSTFRVGKISSNVRNIINDIKTNSVALSPQANYTD
jgi:hypothetical protein